MNPIFCVLTYAIIYVFIHQVILRLYLVKYSLFFQVLLYWHLPIDVVFILSIQSWRDSFYISLMVVKIIYFVLLTFRDNLFISNHSWMFLSSVLICSDICLTSFLSQANDELKEHSRLIQVCVVGIQNHINFLLAMWISFMSIKYKKGPSMDPWGTPVLMKVVSEHVPSNSTNYCLPHK